VDYSAKAAIVVRSAVSVSVSLVHRAANKHQRDARDPGQKHSQLLGDGRRTLTHCVRNYTGRISSRQIRGIGRAVKAFFWKNVACCRTILGVTPCSSCGSLPLRRQHAGKPAFLFSVSDVANDRPKTAKNVIAMSFRNAFVQTLQPPYHKYFG